MIVVRACVLILCLSASASAQDPAALRTLIDARYDDVQWITTAALAAQLRSDEPPLLLDVRTAEEFAVSHIRGARRLDPDTPNFDVLPLQPNTRVVVYCSVGYRSAAVIEGLRARGVTDIKNLVGGLFEWANEGRALHARSGRVQRVHPYDETWGRLLRPERRAQLSN